LARSEKLAVPEEGSPNTQVTESDAFTMEKKNVGDPEQVSV